jgi:hypothetical protein
VPEPFWPRRTNVLPGSRHPSCHPSVITTPDQHGSTSFGWHRHFADARQRLHDWVARTGTRLERNRPTRQTSSPGELPADAVDDIVISDRVEDFVQFVVDDVARRREAERAFSARAESR